jgi:hypothetical protein
MQRLLAGFAILATEAGLADRNEMKFVRQAFGDPGRKARPKRPTKFGSSELLISAANIVPCFCKARDN